MGKWNTGILPGAEYEVLFAEVQRAWRVAGNPAGMETFFHAAGHAVNNPAAFAWLTAARPTGVGAGYGSGRGGPDCVRGVNSWEAGVRGRCHRK
jgi:hypothetical protein